ncbi:MAG TPA: glycosyltransferase [Vicinamibacterales bacterium]|nr:glycosyltransferase [Vicinamibacterales bacterium]
MTVLYFADTRFPIERANGVQMMATCYALARRGHDVTLVTRPDSAASARDPFAFYDWPPISTLRVNTIGVSGGARGRRVRFLLGSARVAASARDAVVFTRDLGLAAWLLQIPRLARPPLVYESHGLADVVAAEMPRLLGDAQPAPSPAKLRRLARREQRVWKRAGAYVAITRGIADELTTRFGGRANVFVVPDGARAQPPEPARGSEPFVAAYAGHLYPWKGVDVFVQALAAVPGVHGLIVGGHQGEQDLNRVRGLVRALRLESRIEITGMVPPGDVPRRLARASALVLPNTATAISERYTSPLKLFEYLSVGRPIVASDLASVREVLTDEQTALLVPPGDAHAMAGALMRLQRDPALAAQLAAGAARLAPQYTWDARAVRLEAALGAARSA